MKMKAIALNLFVFITFVNTNAYSQKNNKMIE